VVSDHKREGEETPRHSRPLVAEPEAGDVYRAIFDSMPYATFTVDAEMHITDWNRSAEQLTGYAARDVIGMPCEEVLRSGLCHAGCALRTTLRTGKTLLGIPSDIVIASGAVMHVSVSTAPLLNNEGIVVGGVETFRNAAPDVPAISKSLRSHSFHGIIGKSDVMKTLFLVLPDVAESDSTVLIEGPSGSGKGLLARVIHDLSPRRDQPFVTVNCAALPDTLLESELFGYKKGAFTDAAADKPGRFDIADGGTIFLDEVADISLGIQAKLLRVLEEKTFEPLGATKTKKVDVRVIVATNRPLLEHTRMGRFREDLYYRLDVIRLDVPPLSARRADIPLLVSHFIEKLNREKRRNVVGITPEAMCALVAYDFPGNVRELENIVERAFILHKATVIDVESLPPDVVRHANHEPGAPRPQWGALESAEADALLEALARNDGHRERTAHDLGIHKTTLIRKMKRLGIRYP